VFVFETAQLTGRGETHDEDTTALKVLGAQTGTGELWQ